MLVWCRVDVPDDMTTKELLAKHHPYPFWVIGDRYGGSYSGGDFTCFWNADYPDSVLSGDTECMMIWEEINGGDWPPLDVILPDDRRVGVGVGPTPDDAIWAAAKRAGIHEKRTDL
jgi:hypothetical protein